MRRKIKSLVSDFGGDAGVYVQHLKSGLTVAINADTLFPTASTPREMAGLLLKVRRGEGKGRKGRKGRKGNKGNKGNKGSKDQKDESWG